MKVVTSVQQTNSKLLFNPAVERRVIRVRRHWAVLLKALLLTTGIIGWVFFLSQQVNSITGDHWLVQSWLWYIGVGALVCFAWEMLDWWTTIFIITDKRFMITTGIIVKKNSSMPITKLTDMSFSSSLVGQLLGYGTLQVESAGKKQALKTIKYLPRPGFFLAVSELIYGDKGDKQPRAYMLEPPRSYRRRRRWVHP